MTQTCHKMIHFFLSRIGGTSYLYRSGLDLAKLHQSGRWVKDDSTTVKHYLKPGLYSTPPEILRERKPQYKRTFTMKRLIFLRNKIFMKGKTNHCFNSILKELDFPKLVRDSYPTAECMEKTKKLQALVHSNSFLDRVQIKVQDRMETQLRKDEQGWEFRANFHRWKGDWKSGQLPEPIVPSENTLHSSKLIWQTQKFLH